MGIAPVIGFHYGAQNHEELKGLRKKSIRIIGISGICMVIAAQLLATPLAKIFVGYDKALYELTVSGFRIFACSFFFMGFAIFISGFFTALNDGLTSALISFLRTLVFESAAIMLLPLIFQITGVWFSVVVAESMAFVIGLLLLFVKRKKYNY